MSPILYLLPYILSALISLWVGLIAWRRSSPGSRLFAAVAFSETIWAVGYALQLAAPGLSGKLFWNNIQFLGAVAAPLAYLGFSIEFYRPPAARGANFTWKSLIPLAVLMLVFIWSDGLHGLFRGQPVLSPGEPFNRLVFPNGPGFIAYTVYAYSLIVLTTLIFISRYLYAGQLYRVQVGIVLLGVLIPWVASLLAYFSLVPFELHQITPAAFGPGNLIIAWALYRYRLFDLLPVARDYLFEYMQEGILVLDQNLRIIDLNPAAQRILAVEKFSAIGRNIADFPPFEKAWFERGYGKVEIVIEREGTTGLYEVQSSLVGESAGSPGIYLAVLRDIQERKRAEEKLRRLATTDPLTGVFNRRQVILLAEREIARARKACLPVAVILLDIDHFKHLNDTIGHRAGDKALKETARACQENLRSGDIFGRYGGDEFIAILPETGLEIALGVAERLRQRIEALPVLEYSQPPRVTVSLGVAASDPGCPSSLDNLLEQADRALYHAKESGRNRVSFL
ncbi:MAG: diguanylate cyclase [Anaerolineae bacterium]|nr:diguanylate cyclase [Anaerolineae bacterium]